MSKAAKATKPYEFNDYLLTQPAEFRPYLTELRNLIKSITPNAEEVFVYLKTNGVKIGLDTGFSKEITNVIINRLGWLKDGKIDYVVSSDEVPAGRPQPYMIQKMMKEAGIEDAKKVVKLGDTEVDVNEGKNAGCLYTIGVTTGAFTREQLEPYEPSFIIDDLKELIDILENKVVNSQ